MVNNNPLLRARLSPQRTVIFGTINVEGNGSNLPNSTGDTAFASTAPVHKTQSKRKGKGKGKGNRVDPITHIQNTLKRRLQATLTYCMSSSIIHPEAEAID